MEHINFQKYQVNEQLREITFSCCSDLPYQRYDDDADIFYNEILVISDDAVDLSRLNNSAPLLFNHNPDQLLGMVEKAYIIENKIYVKVRFSRNDAFADRIYKDILDGVVKNVSIGYQIQAYEDKKENGVYNRYITRWLIYETSIVSIPADASVGVRALEPKETNNMDDGKSTPIDPEKISLGVEEKEQTELEKLQAENQQLKQQIETLERLAAEPENTPAAEPQETAAEPAPAPEETPEVEPEETAADIDDETKDEIEAIGKDFEVPAEEIQRAIANKMSVREFKKSIKTKNFNQKENKIMNAKREFTSYLRAGNFTEKFTLRAFDGFGGQAGENGAALIGSENYPLVAALTKKMGVKGFRTLSGLTSNISIPVQTGRSTIEKKDNLRDTASVTAPVFTNKTLSPVKFVGNVRIGKELLVQANDDVVAFIIDSLTKEIGYKLQAYMLDKVAAGAAGSVTYSAIDAIDWADVLAFEAGIAGYDVADASFVMSPAARAALKGIEEAAGTAQFLCDGDNNINGYAANVSGCVANNNIYYGAWERLICGIFGEGLEIVVDNLTLADTGDVRVIATLCADAVIDAPDAFVVGKVQESSSSSSN